MSSRIKAGATNQAFVPDDGHSNCQGTRVTDVDLEDVVPQLPHKMTSSSTPKNSSPAKYGSQCPLPPGAGSGAKNRPTDLAIPRHINSLHPKPRPESEVHVYEEVPNSKRGRGEPRLLKMSISDERYTPSPTPASRPGNYVFNYSKAGSDVTMISDGPRKRQNPLYDDAKNIQMPSKRSDESSSKCGRKGTLCLWIALFMLGVLILVIFILLMLTIFGVIGTKSSTGEKGLPTTSDPNEPPQGPLSQQLATALRQIKDLEKKIEQLESAYALLRNSTTNSSLSTDFEQVKNNVDSNKKDIDQLQKTVNSHTAELAVHRRKISQNEADISTISLSNYNLERAVDDIRKTLPSINKTANAAYQDVKKLEADVRKLEQTAADCILKTVTKDSGPGAATLETEYVYESSAYVIVGLECSASGFSTTTRDFDIIGTGKWEKQYRCLCAGPDAQALKLSCGLHAVMCKTDPNAGS